MNLININLKNQSLYFSGLSPCPKVTLNVDETPPPKALFAASKQVAEDLLIYIENHIPGFPKMLIDGLDLTPLILYSLTFKLARHEISLLGAPHRKPHSFQFRLTRDSLIPPALMQKYWPQNKRLSWNLYTDCSKKNLDFFNNLKYLPNSLSQTEQLVVIGRQSDFSFFNPILKNDRYYLIKKNDRYDPEILPDQSYTLSATTYPAWSKPFLENLKNNLIQLTEKAGNLGNRNFEKHLHLCLHSLLKDLCLASLSQSMLEVGKFKEVIGCLEKTPFGPIFSALTKKYPVKVFNFQHGLIPQTYTSGFSHFYRFFTWNESSAKMLLNDGYVDKDSIRITGHPDWFQDLPLDPIVQKKIAKFKGKEKTVLILEQPIKAPNILAEDRRSLFSSITELLNTNPHLRILVKRHPNSQSPIYIDKDERVFVLSGNTDLRTCISECDVAAGMPTAAFYQVLAQGKNFILWNPSDISSKIGLDYEGQIPIAQTKESFKLMIENALNNSDYNFENSVSSELIPKTNSSYEKTIRSQL